MAIDSSFAVALRTVPIAPAITALIFVANGELDMLDAPQLWQDVDQVISQYITPATPVRGQHFQIIFNLSGLRFVDSSLVHLLRTTQRRLEHEYNLPITNSLPAAMLCVCGATGFALRAIQLMRLDRIVWVFDTEETALAHSR